MSTNNCHFLRTERSSPSNHMRMSHWWLLWDFLMGTVSPVITILDHCHPSFLMPSWLKVISSFFIKTWSAPEKKFEIVAKWKPVKNPKPRIVGVVNTELCSLHIAGSLWVLRLSQITGECGSFSQQEGPLPSGLGPGPYSNLTYYCS